MIPEKFLWKEESMLKLSLKAQTLSELEANVKLVRIAIIVGTHGEYTGFSLNSWVEFSVLLRAT